MLETTRPYGEAFAPYLSSLFAFGIATEPWELHGYWALRREIFWQEQRLFGSAAEERDQHDPSAIPIVAIAHSAGTPDRVVGTVRIFEVGDALWYGGRLGVERRYRTRPAVGAGLIREAVCQARQRGCQRFLATVLEENARYFTRFHFVPLERLELCGRRHVLMQADLRAYAALLAQRGRTRST
jgi:putative N-acetyltransferase (TIGR04045 family)